MANVNSRLLSPTELLEIYGIPILGDSERRELFTFNEAETKALQNFQDHKNSLYFAICLVFFKIRRTLVNFTYQDVTAERQHVMERYFPHKPSPKSLPGKYTKIRIENKVLELCGYQRLTSDIKEKTTKELCGLASRHPRQRQLCKELLNAFVKHRVSIPGYTTLQDIVRHVWNTENKRLIHSYLRHTRKDQRKAVLSLLDKTNDSYRIISIKQDMKGFNTHELWRELEKQERLKPLFDIARSVLPQIGLPTTTIFYYATLIQYYDGSGLKQLNKNAIGLYLLCYAFTRYQALNDNLLDAFKKKTLEYKKKAVEYAKNKASDQLDLIQEIREQTSELLITIKNHPASTISKKKLFNHIPEDQLLTVAHLLVDDNFNKERSFWKGIDNLEDSIKLNLRKLFLGIDFAVTNNEPLNKTVSYFKNHLIQGSLLETPCPAFLKSWIGKQYRQHILQSDTISLNRLKFLLYMRMVYHLKSNKLTLQHSLKHKKIEDEIYNQKKWAQEKKTILKSLDYPKLLTPIQETLAIMKTSLNDLYLTVNKSIEKGENPSILLKKDKKGNRIWRLSPLEVSSDPNDSLFALLEQRSIVEVIQFVNHKTQFCRLFDPILPRSTKNNQDPQLIGAVVLANAIRIGVRKMASICDLKESALLTTEASCVRLETLLPAIDRINNEVAKFPIFKAWYIRSILHGSLDGLKIETSIKNIMARHSTKFFAEGTGVSAYNEIVNGLSVAGRLIGAHEYEGHFAFEMAHHQNTSEIKPTILSTDKHGMNVLNFALFDFTDMIYAPRIPKIHREILWGFGHDKDYEGLLIKPTQFVNSEDEDLIVAEWDNMQRVTASLLTGEASPSTIIRKLCAKEYTSQTKKALVLYNHLVRSRFILTFLHNKEFRRAILYALNWGGAV
jgi:hypothetical protein